MSHELHAYTTPALTLYAVLINSTGQIWNGSAFETLAGANWTDYDLAMTEAAAGIYLGNMPAVAAGAYSYVVYEQAGANPATSDALRGVGYLVWDGSAEVVMPSAADNADATLDALAADHNDPDTIGEAINNAGGGSITVNASVAISAAVAATVASGSLAVRTHHTFSQAITTTSTAALNTATKLWLAIKESDADADTAAIVFLEASAGLTVLAGAAYTTTGHGTLVLSGSSGAWTITAGLDEVATGLLTAYAGHTLYAECKALVGSSTVAVWDGNCEVSRGIVQAVA